VSADQESRSHRSSSILKATAIVFSLSISWLADEYLIEATFKLPKHSVILHPLTQCHLHHPKFNTDRSPLMSAWQMIGMK
jgi:hypothetical protein